MRSSICLRPAARQQLDGKPESGDWANIAAITRHGFTGHEHLDNLTLIHMNGRVYDAVIGRFTSADPVIPGAFFSQSFNRYSYVWNNPGSFTDPSGFSPDELYDFDSPDGGRRRDCDAFCRAMDSLLREMVASTRENRREWPSYLFLEPEAGTPYPSLPGTPGINPTPGISGSVPWPGDRSQYRWRRVAITEGPLTGEWYVLKSAPGYTISWPPGGKYFGRAAVDPNASAAFHDWEIVPSEDPSFPGAAYSISTEGRVLNVDLGDETSVEVPPVDFVVPEIDLPVPSIPELEEDEEDAGPG